MKKLFLCLIIFPAVFQSQIWSRLGADKVPVDPLNIMNNHWGINYNGLIKNIGNGRVQAIWVDPDDANHVLIGTYGGGIYETYNALAELSSSGFPNPPNSSIHWEHITKDIPVHLVGKIIKQNNVLYAAAGGFYMNAGNYYYGNAKESRNLYGLGVIKSFDNGSTWQISDMPNPESGFLCGDFTPPSDRGIMYAASRHKVYKSFDYGDKWTDLNITFTQEGYTNRIISRIVAHPSDPNTVFVSTSSGPLGVEKVFFSKNGGSTWSDLGSLFNYNTSLPGFFNSIATTSVYVYNNDLYISLNKSYNTAVIKSSDWTNFSVVGNYVTSTPYAFSSASVDYIKTPANDYLYGMTSLLKLGANNSYTNLTYNEKNNKTHDDIRSVAFATNRGTEYIFAGHDGGISRSKDGGNTWQNIMGDLNAPLLNNMGYYTDPLDRAFDIGTQDTGWYRNDLTNPPSGSFVTRAWEGAVYTSLHNSKRIYFGTNQYTENNGAPPLQNLNTTFRGMAEDPLDYKIRYHFPHINGFVIYDNNLPSPNLFPLFANTSTGMDNIGIQPKIALNSNKNILFPIMYYTYPPPIYFQKHMLIFSKDRGQNWEDIGKNIKNADSGLPDVINHPGAMLTCVTMDDYNPNRMWVVFAGSGLINQKVYESNDFGKTWQNISYNLSNVASLGLPPKTPGNYPANQIEYDENRDILFLGTDYGLFYLDKNTKQWKIYGTGLPRAVITNIFVDDYYNEIVVGTANNGIWSAPLSDCKDMLIMEDTTWTGQNQTICGDLRVKHDFTLNVNKSNITAKNIVLEPGAKILWDGGVLNSTNPNQKSFAIGVRNSKFSIKNVTVNDYTFNNFENATLETGSIIANNSSFNVYGGSFYDNNSNSLLTLNDSFLNFYASYYHKTHNTTPNFINSEYYSGIGTINMTGTGKIKVYDKDIDVQNDDFLDKTTPVINDGNYWFESNNSISVGKNVNNVYLWGEVSAASNVDMVSKKFITFEPGTTLSNFVFARIDGSISDDLSTPYSKYNATDGDIVYSEDNEPDWESNRFGNFEEEENDKYEREIGNKEKEEVIKIYPNPVVDHIKYKLQDTSLIGSEFRIVDLNGNELYKGKFITENGEIKLTKNYPDIFLFVFNNKNEIKSIKILRQRLTDETHKN
ncbi:MAG: hypothetical protein LBE36_00775 [Flavobacteriaceae bacterium]|jgi:photosystem II stability/assembly factor-like uncharacterized protein|nr:hypothetical protein [Flavobacteriaceae bacterium]